MNRNYMTWVKVFDPSFTELLILLHALNAFSHKLHLISELLNERLLSYLYSHWRKLVLCLGIRLLVESCRNYR